LIGLSGFDETAGKRLTRSGYNAVAFDLSAGSEGLRKAQEAARKVGLRAYGWIQVGRDETAAKAHPEWLHVPQHNEWLEGKGPEVAAVFPWVCVNNRAVFDYELARIKRLLPNAEGLSGLFLCDIQGPPNGCGCGNILCRSWDNSPGEKVADSPYRHPTVFFSKVFTEAVQQAYPTLSVLPVLCEECENGLDVGAAHNPDALSGACHGIPCLHPCSLDYYPGLLHAIAGPSPIGLLTPYKAFKRDRWEYGGEAAWVGAAVGRVHQIVPGQSVWTVLEGWDTDAKQQEAQQQQAERGGASGTLTALIPIDQSARPIAVSSLPEHPSHSH
jgi:hypothetical protein